MITANELTGSGPKVLGGTPSVRHQLEDDEPVAPAIPRSKLAETAERKLKVLVTLESGPKTSKRLANETGEPADKMKSVCNMLSAAGLIERAPKNSGYQLTEKGVAAGRDIPQEKPVATKQRKKRATKAGAGAATPRVTKADPSFAVTDQGELTIITLEDRTTLSLSATKRLAVFIERTKDLRK